MKYIATLDGTTHVVEVAGGDGRYRLTIGDDVWDVDARLTAQGIYSLLIGGVSYVADVVDREGTCVVDVGGEAYEVLVEEQTRWIIRTKGGAAGAAHGQTLTAPVSAGSITGLSFTDYKQPASYQFSFGVQQQLMRNSVLSVAYVGNQNRHQNDYRDVNLPDPRALCGQDRHWRVDNQLDAVSAQVALEDVLNARPTCCAARARGPKFATGS